MKKIFQFFNLSFFFMLSMSYAPRSTAESSVWDQDIPDGACVSKIGNAVCTNLDASANLLYLFAPSVCKFASEVFLDHEQSVILVAEASAVSLVKGTLAFAYPTYLAQANKIHKFAQEQATGVLNYSLARVAARLCSGNQHIDPQNFKMSYYVLSEQAYSSMSKEELLLK